jgi:Lrp/AsnC family transcriptional regulator for asnA, asnC and gidA
MYEIDKLDVRIVNLLLQDGRMPASVIARQLNGISERVVRYRIERMVENDVIRLSAIVSPKAFGLDTNADVWLEVESDKILEVANNLAEFENVTYVACGIGEADVSIQVVGESTGDIYRFVTEIVRKVPGVRKTVTSIVPIVIKDVYQWRIPEKVSSDAKE